MFLFGQNLASCRTNSLPSNNELVAAGAIEQKSPTKNSDHDTNSDITDLSVFIYDMLYGQHTTIVCIQFILTRVLTWSTEHDRRSGRLLGAREDERVT